MKVILKGNVNIFIHADFFYRISVSLLLPDEENDTKEEEKLNAQQTSSRINDSWFPQLAYASDKSSLIEVEELEEKVFSASLQVKVRSVNIFELSRLLD